MTHKGFKDIILWYQIYNLEKINQFLDGKIEDPLLQRWFEQWKTGNYRIIFDEIDALNEIYFTVRSNRNLPQSAFTKPIETKNINAKVNFFISLISVYIYLKLSHGYTFQRKRIWVAQYH